ncbi:hypothetical protein JXJ21_21025 [candidate division KSB1 bacterium]|nr:hypothetical protein [candidate division KSB1 bacterium]
MEYKTTTEDAHLRAEELQWAKILASGNPVYGMLLVLVQKLCTAFHEFEPAWHGGHIKAQSFQFYKDQLVARLDKVIVMARINQLDALNGMRELKYHAEVLDGATSCEALANLTEKIHEVNHVISDALEQAVAGKEIE